MLYISIQQLCFTGHTKQVYAEKAEAIPRIKNLVFGWRVGFGWSRNEKPCVEMGNREVIGNMW
jgi:hypothetical protein